MSYQQTTTEATFNRAASGTMYAQQAARTHADAQARSASFAQGQTAGAQNENVPINSILNQFAGLSLPGATAMPVGTNQIPMAGQMFYTPDGQLVYAPGMYSAQSLPSVSEGAYNSYPATLPYLPQTAYASFVPGYPTMPYTPARSAYYQDRSEHLSKDVPGLENRRGSYSTNESAPGTPYYGSMVHQGTHIAPLDRSPFGSTPSPQQLSVQHAKQISKSPPYSVPIGIDIHALVKQYPAIPEAVPAVFTPEENKRTLDQSLHNPIKGNRNVYIRGLHPDTNDHTLALYANRFGKVETSKAIIDTTTGACKGYTFLIPSNSFFLSDTYLVLALPSITMFVIPSFASVDSGSLVTK